MDMVTYAALQKQIREAPAVAVPRVVSAFENDAGYQTAEQVQAAADAVAAQIPTVPTKLSAFENDARYQTATEVNTAVGAVATALTAHNTDTDAHNDIRIALQNLVTNINTILDSDDTTLDQLSEIVAYIKSNKTLIDGVTTSKVSYSDIVDNLVTNLSNKPLSAAQGVALKALIDAIVIPTNVSAFANDAKYATEGQVAQAASAAEAKIPTKVSQFTNDAGYQTATQVKTAIDDAQNVFIVEFDVSLSANGLTLSLPSDVTFEDVSNAYTDNYHVLGVFEIPSVAGEMAGKYIAPLNKKQSDGSLLFVSADKSNMQWVQLSPDAQVSFANSHYEFTGNKVTDISASSTNVQYPSAKAVYDYIESRLNGLTFKTAASAPTVDDDSVITFVDEG